MGAFTRASMSSEGVPLGIFQSIFPKAFLGAGGLTTFSAAQSHRFLLRLLDDRKQQLDDLKGR